MDRESVPVESTAPLLEGLILIQPEVYRDSRGFFLETFNEERFRQLGVDCTFVQDNHSCSAKGTIRGLHFQSDPGQDKLIRVAEERIFDVVVDIPAGAALVRDEQPYAGRRNPRCHRHLHPGIRAGVPSSNASTASAYVA